MGVTGLETAFAAIHTELVMPGVLDLGLVVERMTAGGAALRHRGAQPRGGLAGQHRAGGPRRRVGGGGGRLREPLRQLRLGRPPADRPRAHDGGSRARGVPRALVRHRGGGLSRPERYSIPSGRPSWWWTCRRPSGPRCATSTRRPRNVATLVQGARDPRPAGDRHRAVPEGARPDRPEVAEHLDGAEPIEKVCFSAADADGFDLGGRDQALVCGIEAHVCVSQTAHDLLDDGRGGARGRATR